MEIEHSQPMPMPPRPTEPCVRRIEQPHNPVASGPFRHAPGTVPFDVYLEGSNRIAREGDTFRLTESNPQAKKPDLATQTLPKTGWARLGEVLAVLKPPKPSPGSPPQPQTVVQRHAGTGRLIDVII